jgi:DNA-binding phage protein
LERKRDNQRDVYLALINSLNAQLREAYVERYEEGIENQSTLAKKLGVGRSTINKRLRGETNLTAKTVADMVWALGQCIEIDIYDPDTRDTNGKRVLPNIQEEWNLDSAHPMIKNHNRVVPRKYVVSRVSD